MVSFQFEAELSIALVHFLILCPCEHCLPAQKEVEDHSKRENIALWLDVLGLIESNDLWRDIAWSSAPEEQVLINICISCESEVDDDRL